MHVAEFYITADRLKILSRFPFFILSFTKWGKLKISNQCNLYKSDYQIKVTFLFRI